MIRLWREDGGSVDDAIESIGHMPLPPYIKRDDRAADRERYQTVFARERGSVAAPTAGLHFTPGAQRRRSRPAASTSSEITLHVGYGTFQPVRVDRVEDHRIEAERYTISETAAQAINRARDDGRRIVAVGTTTTRTLEAAAAAGGGRVTAGTGTTDLFIFPGYAFRIVRGPADQLSPAALVAAACWCRRSPASSRVRAAYAAAIAGGYRFYSYGDAMLVT